MAVDLPDPTEPSQSEEQFRAIVEANPSPVRVAYVDSWKILYESPAAAALFGRPWRSGEDFSTIETYADMADREDVVRELESKGRVDNREVLMRRTDGSTFWVSLSTRLFRFQDRELCVTSLIDLTEAKAREAELTLARETLEDAIESLSEGFVLYDADDRLVLCNSQYKDFNQEAADLLVPGAYWPDVTRARAERGFFSLAKGNVEAWLAGQMAQRGIAKNEVFPASGDRWYEYSHRPTRQGGFVSTWRDITERMKMEQALRESEERVRHVLEACPVPIAMSRAEDAVVIYENPATRALLNLDGPRDGESAINHWVSLVDRAAYLGRLHKTGAVDSLEVNYRKATGEVFWCSLSSRLIDYRGEAVIVSNLVDLTERHAAEAELAQQREMLHQTEKLSALGELLAGVSHELNNPLSVLVGQALMLQEEATDDRILARAERIGNAANRCARIVKSFLAMARQEPSVNQPVALNEVIEAALEVTSYSLRALDIEVSLELAEELPAVLADPDQMRQVITNLIVNAQHALQDAPGPRCLQICSSYRPPSDRIVVQVKDNGPGIPAELKSRIFEPLFTTKEVGTGTGIGLAICHRVVESLGGAIEVESALGEGAVFTLRLPVAPAAAEPVGEAAPGLAKGTALRVLVVDDDQFVGEIISEILEYEGHQVEVAFSGKQAMAKLESTSYDIILSDIRMPEMDGPTFYRALSERWPERVESLAFITGDSLGPGVRSFLTSSQRPYLEKPVTPEDVCELVDLLMQRRGAADAGEAAP